MERNPLLPEFPNWKGYYGVDYPTMMFNIPELFMLVGTFHETTKTAGTLYRLS